MLYLTKTRYEVVVQQKEELELGNEANEESNFESGNENKEWEADLLAL